MARDVLWDLGAELQDITMAWHNGEKHSGVEIVDANLSGQPMDKVTPISWKQARARYITLDRKIPYGTTDADFMHATIKSRLSYIDAQHGLRVPPIIEYLRETVGMEPREASYGELVKLQRAYHEAFIDVAGRPFTLEGAKRFLDETRLTGEEYFQACLEAENRFKQPFEDATGQEFNPLRNASLVSRPGYWLAWTSYDENGERMLLNSNSRVANRRRRGSEDLVVGHEGAHVVMDDSWAAHVQNREINPAYSTMAITDPVQSVNEPMATAIFKYIPGLENQMTDHGRLILTREVYKNAVMGNVHLWINGYSGGPEDVRKYVRDRGLPEEVNAHFETELTDRTRQLQYRGYLDTYTDSYEFIQIADSLTEDQRLRVFKELMQKPMMHKRFIDCVEQVRRSDVKGLASIRQASTDSPQILRMTFPSPGMP